MGYGEAALASDTKVPDMGQRRFENYQQTVPVQEELDLPPSYEEASSSQVARTHSTGHSGSSSAIRTPSSQDYSSRHSSLDAEPNDGLLRHDERVSQTQGQERQRQEQGRVREQQQQRRREEQSRQREQQRRERELQRQEQQRAREEQQRSREEQRREREQQREEQQRDREEQQRNREEQRRHREEAQQHPRCQGRYSRGDRDREHDADSDASSVNTAGYKSTDPMHWEMRTRHGDWESQSSEPGCCGSTTGGCCFSSRGGCCFSDRDGCCFSDRDGCCFSDRGGCFFSDLDGAFFSSGGGCCFSHHSTEKDNHGVRL